jgi:lipooligosaccharide transport system ATP-binding protein
MRQPVIIAENVNKCYGTFKALKNCSFSVDQSICFGLLGPNGAGKTTLMKLMYGANRRECEPSGRLSVFGNDPQKNELAIKFISGVVPQDNNLDEELNVEQNLQVFARFYNIPGPIAKKRITELLEFMELTDKHTARIRELSGGMKRRLIIARALLNNPRLLFLDEPTTGLDPQVRHLIWEKLRNLKKQGMTIVLTTHYMDEAFQICDQIMIMNKGEKILEGNPHALVSDMIEPFVMEIHTTEAFELMKATIPEQVRVDNSTDMKRLYTKDQTIFRKLSDTLKPGQFYIRQSNLEDLFLKATGSTLNVNQ